MRIVAWSPRTVSRAPRWGVKATLAMAALWPLSCGKATEAAEGTSLVSVRVNWNAPHPEAGFQPRSYALSVDACALRAAETLTLDAASAGVLNLVEGDTGCRAYPSRVTYADAKGNTREYALESAPQTFAAGGTLTLVAADARGDVSFRVQLGAVLPSPLPAKATISFGLSPVKAAGAGEGITELGHFKETASGNAGETDPPSVPLVVRQATESPSDALEGNRAFFVVLSCEEALVDDVCAGKSLLDFRYRFLAADGAFASAAAASSGTGAKLSATEARALFAESGDDRRPTIAHYDGNGLRVLVEDLDAEAYVFAVRWGTAVRVFRFKAP